jgi:hypothetical protein
MQKDSKLPAKLITTNPWEVLCVDLIGPYTLKGKDSTQIEFMCVTMINSITSWFGIVELPVSKPSLPDIPMCTEERRGNNAQNNKQPYFDKISATVGTHQQDLIFQIPT